MMWGNEQDLLRNLGLIMSGYAAGTQDVVRCCQSRSNGVELLSKARQRRIYREDIKLWTVERQEDSAAS